MALAARYVADFDALAQGAVRVAVGEPTVRVALGGGRGGRAQQLALAVARRLAGRPVAFVALGSDGTDGPTDAAGAAVEGATWDAARARGLDPAGALERSDAHPLLDAVGALVRTGPTGTNLLDLHLLARTGPG
jgi:hydroxypyruvate reductase